MNKVTVYLNEGAASDRALTGECPLFGSRDYREGYDNSLRDYGIWLSDWRFAGNSGAAHKGKVFIPWTSILYIESE